jgi:hypothetical protein
MGLVDRAKNIIMTPKTEWPAIAGEEANVGKVISGYVFPLALASAIASFIGYGFIWSIFHSVNWGIYHALVVVISGIVGVYVSAFIINALAPSFGSEQNMGRAVQLVAYSFTPSWIGGLLMIFPMIGWIGSLFGFYGLYLLYLGLPTLMKTPQEKAMGYEIVSILCIIVVYIVVGLILASVFLGMFGLSMAGRGMWGM